jgi:FtsZ-interacting cell division protein ZipA
MLDAAQIMAELLGGDIRGPQREPLRDADAKALRARVRALLNGSTEAADTP